MNIHHLYGFMALYVLASSIARGQSTKAELFGILRDRSGLPVSSATVELVNARTESKLTAESDTGGVYHFFALPAGSYQITVTKTGFSTLRRDGIVVRVGEQVSLDLQLPVGDVAQSIVVTEAAPLLRSTRG